MGEIVQEIERGITIENEQFSWMTEELTASEINEFAALQVPIGNRAVPWTSIGNKLQLYLRPKCLSLIIFKYSKSMTSQPIFKAATKALIR